MNPVSDTARAGPDVKRERVLTISELGEIYLSASKSGDVFGDIVRFLMLTGQRRGEVLGATIEEIDFEGRIWRLPAARTKNNREHIVPLSLTCIDIIRSRPKYGNILFSTSSGTPFGAVDKAKKRLDKMILDRRMFENSSAKPMPHWTLHDLRRSFVTHCHGELGITLPVLERAINHVSGSFGGVVGIYNRAQLLPERVAAFEAWEDYVLRSADCVTGRVELVKGDGRHA
ncbi:site-specific integrase [Methylorubrum populi]